MAARPIWLVFNDSSGSNEEGAIEQLVSHCSDSGMRVVRRSCFPADDLPSAAELDAAGIDCVAVFAGDGTINATIMSLYGWGGAVLVLPGGTMNLLSRRLHGDAETGAIIARVSRGVSVRTRLNVVRSAHGDCFAGILAGPGTAWSRVREAMRETDLASMAAEALEALRETTGGSMIRCAVPAIGREGGYPLIELTPGESGMEIAAYHAESAGEYMRQGLALVRRSFRDGPHDVLGMAERLVLADTGDAPLGVLIDGEPAEGTANEEAFEVTQCEVDLVATGRDG